MLMTMEIYAEMFLWKRITQIKIFPVTTDAAFLNFPKAEEGKENLQLDNFWNLTVSIIRQTIRNIS